MDLPIIKLIRSAFGLLCLGSLIFAVACSSSTSASYSQPAAQSRSPFYSTIIRPSRKSGGQPRSGR